MEDNREFIYRIDRDDQIVFANEDWYHFARENGVNTLNPDTVTGRSLWSFIENIETQHLFQVLLKKIRQTGLSVMFPYRCDSPNCRRYLEMNLIPQANHVLEFRSRILRQEARSPVRLMTEHVERTADKLIMCGWCKKVILPDGCWVEVEEAVSALDLFDAPRLPIISHGMCHECSRGFERHLAGSL